MTVTARSPGSTTRARPLQRSASAAPGSSAATAYAVNAGLATVTGSGPGMATVTDANGAMSAVLTPAEVQDDNAGRFAFVPGVGWVELSPGRMTVAEVHGMIHARRTP